MASLVPPLLGYFVFLGIDSSHRDDTNWVVNEVIKGGRFRYGKEIIAAPNSFIRGDRQDRDKRLTHVGVEELLEPEQ